MLWLIVAIVLSVSSSAKAGCRTYWDGTAPFCSGSCPRNCATLQRSKTGNGAVCWTGDKALCQCCAPTTPNDPLCVPAVGKTSIKCVGGEVGSHLIPVGPMCCFEHSASGKECSAYICGVCWFGKTNNNNSLEVVAHLPMTYGSDRENTSSANFNFPCDLTKVAPEQVITLYE